MHPKVFLCHASEDKERFVLGFAEKMRQKGIDVWLDIWEMYPGDSIVDKIFNEGIKNANAFIVVISKNSIEKSWVKEELNTAVINRIEKKCKLIPIIIDECEVPICLKSLIWERLSDLQNYDSHLDRIVYAIFGKTKKPEIGKEPKYVNLVIDKVPNLSKIDSLILKIACELAIEKNYLFIESIENIDELNNYNFPKERIEESIQILAGRGYIKTIPSNPSHPSFFITTIGFSEYAKVFLKDYNDMIESVSFELINKNPEDNFSIQKSVKFPIIFVDHIIDLLTNRRLIRSSKVLGGGILILNISPELRRIVSRNE